MVWHIYHKWTWLSIDKFRISRTRLEWMWQVCQGTRKPVAAAQEMGFFHKTEAMRIVFFWGKNIITPWKINGWNLQITRLERKMIFQTSMIMFHVNLPGCKDSLNSFKDKPFLTSTSCWKANVISMFFFGWTFFLRQSIMLFFCQW